MDTENLMYLSQQIQQYEKDYLNSIKDGLIYLFQQSIEICVYQYYNPKVYMRTFNLLNDIDFKFEGNKLVIYSNSREMDYHSLVDGSDVSNYVSQWVESGHNDGSIVQNQYHHYEGRNYLEYAKELIRNEYDLDVEIINDEFI
ncbi:MAG: hypothetical protein LIR50_15900 [Bacillota bacterium]|nr:hypothetical protein [Bacillota bacterium]